MTMYLLFLFLIALPIATWPLMSSLNPRRRYLATGMVFGAIVYPLFTGLVAVSMYLAQTLPPLIKLSFISAKAAIFHRAAGYIVVALSTGKAPRGDGDISVYIACAVVWGIVYGGMGWYVDRNPAQNQNKLPLLLLAPPVLYVLISFSFTMVKAAIWNANHSSGTVCYQVMDATPGSHVWLDIGSPPKLQLSRFGGVPFGSTQWCGSYDTSMNPLQIQAYSATDENERKRRATVEDNPSTPFTIPIVANGKSCVGIFPDNSSSMPTWTARIIDCALTSHSSRTR